MKKSKIILFTIVIILVCCLSAVCVACAKKHTHIWDTNWSCVECDEKTELAEHRFNEGECDICGYIAEASHLDFELSEDGSYYIVVGEGNYTVKNLHIPSIHNDKAVKKIGASAFERNKIVTNTSKCSKNRCRSIFRLLEYEQSEYHKCCSMVQDKFC